MSALEIIEYIAVATSILYVILAARENVYCWAMGIIGSAIYIYINLNCRLYLDTILQTYYVVMGVYGWVLWGRKDENHSLKITSSSTATILQLIGLGYALSLAFSFVFQHYFNNALPYLDAAVTVFSFIATWMTAKKILQNWLFWIVIDALAIVLYYYKGLYPTCWLYGFYSLFSVYGYWEWRRNHHIL